MRDEYDFSGSIKNPYSRGEHPNSKANLTGPTKKGRNKRLNVMVSEEAWRWLELQPNKSEYIDKLLLEQSMKFAGSEHSEET